MQHLPSPVAYREDINGLRAWAVIAVLLFHFQLPGLGAGFMGVDIFFVISGFLMTAIIVKGLERGNFSILKFYMARVRRILPALLAMIAVLLGLGWFYLPTFDYSVLATQSLSALFFVSNVFFGLEGSYFSNSPYEKWLLHTWSLAVEAQFYVLFPIFLILLWKLRPRISTVLWGLIGLFFISLALNMVVSGWKPTIAFYVLPTRGWELAAGGLAFLIGREVLALQRFGKPLFWSGFGLWVIALVLLDNSYTWPSGWALLPVIGTVLIILANQAQAKLTVNPVAQWLGDRSYSLYLWHWPLVVALHFVGLQNDWFWVSAALAFSLILAHLSYHFVEVPTRSYLSMRSLRKEVYVIGLAGLVFLSFSLFVKSYPLENRIDPLVDMIASEAGNHNPQREACQPDINGLNSPGCIFGDKTVGAYLIGDSHSDMVATAFGEAAKNSGLGIQFFGRMGCPTIEGVQIGLSSRAACTNFNNWLFEFLENDTSGLPVVVVNAIWHEANMLPKVSFDYAGGGIDTQFEQDFIDGSISSICRIASKRDVWLVRPVPPAGVNVPKQLSRDILLGRIQKDEFQDIRYPLADYHKKARFVWRVQDLAVEKCGAKILDPLPYLCDSESCYGSRDLRPLYYDGGHLSEYGNKFLVPMFEKVFSRQN